MTWFKVDDKFPTHRKVLSIPRGQRRLAAVGAWTLVGAWVSGNTNDGHVPGFVLDDLGISTRVATDLVGAGLWSVVSGGFIVHDYLDYNPSKEQVSKDREAAADRQRKARDKAKSRRDADVTHTEVTSPVTDTVTVPPTRPDPTPKEQTPTVSARKRAAPRTSAPDDMLITPEMSAWGREHAPLISDPKAETVRFLDHARANGKTFADWTAAWRTWMGNAQKYADRDGAPQTPARRPEPAWMR